MQLQTDVLARSRGPWGTGGERFPCWSGEESTCQYRRDWLAPLVGAEAHSTAAEAQAPQPGNAHAWHSQK